MCCFDESKYCYYKYKNYGNSGGCGYIPPIPNHCGNYQCGNRPHCPPNDWGYPCPPPQKPCPPKQDGLVIRFEGSFRLF